ncbi:MAG: hypothetical protein N4A49_10135 [Marinifilaceae bacterium]|jgi:hypothetical protein|nr:hypothetical protein [Marinifilaceae bacterium]
MSKLLLSTLNITAFSLLLILITNPSFVNKKIYHKKANLILAIDNSGSLSYRSKNYNLELGKYIDSIHNRLKTKFNIDKISFGDTVKPLNKLDLNEQSTNFESLLNYIKKSSIEDPNIRNLIITDGIYNIGNNPLYDLDDLKNINFIGLGDTVNYPDIKITNIYHNNKVFTNNKFEIQIDIRAHMLKEKDIYIEIKEDNDSIIQDTINVNSNNFAESKHYYIKTNKTGLRKYIANIKSETKEQNINNNKKLFYVNVLGEKKKIIICYSKYHPDLAAISESINKNPSYETSFININKNKLKLDSVNLIIFHNILAEKEYNKNIATAIKNKSIPYIHIIGGNNVDKKEIYNNEDVQLKSNTIYKALNFKLNQNFNIFDINQFDSLISNTTPPLNNSFFDLKFTSKLHTIVWSDKTAIISIGKNKHNIKTAYINGLGINRWKRELFRLNDNNELFDLFINKIISYTVNKGRKNRFITNINKNFSQYNFFVKAQVFNKAFEASKHANVKIEITDSIGITTEYKLYNIDDHYKIKIAFLKPGKYKYKISANLNSEEFFRKGEFYINRNTIELQNTVADHDILRKIAYKTGSKFVDLSNWQRICKDLNNKSKPQIIQTKEKTECIDYIHILIILLVIITTSWILNRVLK